ncbi:nucleotidyltransferase domain-containing protein [Actinoplanes sp. NPDC049548]|uniref:nucleotidyltransferase domain-containing protein n=1 Tax=Actinoplanes sp. NPDC049548 TaxID=3155152 RepID=UPI003442B9EA
MTSTLDADVARTCTAYLALADRYEPGLVQGLYLQGSLALGDYRPGASDIDFVAVTSRTPDPRALEAIHSGLRRTHGGTDFDGVYLPEDALRRDPDVVPDGPSVHEWRVEAVSRFERNLVTWHVLAQGGIAIRGPAVAELCVYTDWPTLAAETRENLAGYWAAWRNRAALGLAGAGDWATAWGVLGVARLRHTLAAGRVTAKTEAAGYALQTYGQRWHRIVREALRIRTGEGEPQYRNQVHRHLDMIRFVTHVLDHA